MKSVSKLVRLMGLEPIRLLTHAPQTCLSAYSSTTAYLIISAAFTKPLNIYYINSSLFLCQGFFKFFETFTRNFLISKYMLFFHLLQCLTTVNNIADILYAVKHIFLFHITFSLRMLRTPVSAAGRLLVNYHLFS